MNNTGKSEIEITEMQIFLKSKTNQRIRTISNSRILIKPQCCPFTSCTSGRMSKRFKTAWSLLWHMSNSHKQEYNFKQEFKRIQKMVSQ